MLTVLPSIDYSTTSYLNALTVPVENLSSLGVVYLVTPCVTNSVSKSNKAHEYLVGSGRITSDMVMN